ncbi:MAG: formyltetrahydrofolate deformylase [Candidatus Omnitrophica bacterium]|nr:formyltetrahydrofolate deformylase [Candidatus Omnitrophota bacterium]
MGIKLNKKKRSGSAILLIHCSDRKGLVAAVTKFLSENSGNILYLDQHVDVYKKVFFMRVEWELADFKIPAANIAGEFETLIARKFKMKWKLHFSYEVPRVAIFVSKLSHCLYDIVSRCQSGEFRMEIPLIISNHPDLRRVADKFGIAYHLFKITPKNKKAREEKELKLLKRHNVDFVVLARYMQVLSNNFIKEYPNRIINIHHSFLPAFPGRKPYHSAYERGVKVIGATSHYATSKLDRGPIIEQDVVKVSHSDCIEDLIRKGCDLEKIVLSRAIWYHLKRKTLVYDRRTVVFA